MAEIEATDVEQRDSKAFDQWIDKHYPMFTLTGDRESDTTARIVRIVAGHAWKDGRRFDPRNLDLFEQPE